MMARDKTIAELVREKVKVYEDQVKVYEDQVNAYKNGIPLLPVGSQVFPEGATVRIQYIDGGVVESQRKQLETYRAALAPFADLIPASMHGLPESTKFAPKLTLAPFVAAHKALHGEELESP